MDIATEPPVELQCIDANRLGFGVLLHRRAEESVTPGQEDGNPARRGRQPRNLKLSAAEARVVVLGLAMVGLGIAVLFIITITVMQPFLNGQRSEEANCTLISATIHKWIECAFECGSYCQGTASYPCLQVFVNVTPWGRKVLLHQDEQSIFLSAQCYLLPKCYRDQADAVGVIEPLRSSFKALNQTPFRCFYNARAHQGDALFHRSANDSGSIQQWLLFPISSVALGLGLLLLLGLSHTLAGVCESKQTRWQSERRGGTARLDARGAGVGAGAGGSSPGPKSRVSVRSGGIAVVSFRAFGNSLKGEKHGHLP